MKALAEALVFAVDYIDSREVRTDEDLHDDARALEMLAFILRQATEAEKSALAYAAEEAWQAYLRTAGQDRDGAEEQIEERLGRWMENMFPDEIWAGNKRAKC